MGMEEPWQDTVVLTSDIVGILRFRHSLSRANAVKFAAVVVKYRPRYTPSYTGTGISYMLEPTLYIGYNPQPETARTMFKLLMGVL